MPICPRCGKCLSSEQALSYHLNKKYKCGTWACMKCSQKFDTKLQLQLHEMHCGVIERDYPDYGVLRKMYDNCRNTMCEIDNGIIVRSNNNLFIGSRIDMIPEYTFKNDSILIV
tara:strand:+ start:19916 stop:20257 length:342 start_codon:yes stop_codon:yes gene_type:complete